MPSNRHQDNDGVIDLRNDISDADEEAEFRINRVEEKKLMNYQAGGNTGGNMEELPVGKDKVKVKFDKFVNLIATRAYEEVISKYSDEDIVMSTDLLADLASVQEEKSSHKGPVLFIFGIVLGSVIVFLLLKF